MSRYFDADDFFQTFEELDIEPYNNFQTADVVEVVRCRDCIHHQPFPFSDEHICDVHNWKSKEDDFCSFAERRTQ